MARAIVHSGVCGFVTEITGQASDGQTIQLQIDSGCPNVQRLAAEVENLAIDGWAEIMRPRGDGANLSPLAQRFIASIPHPGCPVYSGLVKVIEVTLGTALPADVHITLHRDG